MIIVKLTGGLGNQLFQYALGRHLALMNGTALAFDISYYELYPLRRYELDVFNIEKQIMSPEMMRSFLPNPPKSFLSRIRNKIKDRHGQYQLVMERQLDFQPAVLESRANTILEGYWQSEKYFAAVSSVIRKELSFKAAPPAEVKALLSRIASVNAVSVHVRRGDYVSNPDTNSIHGTCDTDYYRRAIAFMKEKLKDPVFFFFSDDMAWTQENLKPDAPHYYSEHGGEACEDLRLMSHCKHHIIANSSFSWWGAWLNPSSGKLVLCPDKWFNDPKRAASDLIPSTWIRI